MNVNTMYILALVLTLVSCSVGKNGVYFYFQKFSLLKQCNHHFMERSIDMCTIKCPCAVSISKPWESSRCKIQREKGVALNRQFYQFTVSGEQGSTNFPYSNIPFLNQTFENVAYHTALDPVDSKWGTLFKTFIGAKKMMTKKLPKMQNFNISDYIINYKLYNKMIKMMRAPQYFSNPAMENTFTDIIENDRWFSDELFVQQRLAGMCPFLIQKVTVSGSVGMKWSVLKKQLNPAFNFDSAIQDALGLKYTLEEVVHRGMLYALYHEGFNDIKTPPDHDAKMYASLPRKMLKVTSPITLFVRTSLGELKVVSVQMDYKPESQVLTPKSDAISWFLAKSTANLADTMNCQGIYHLSHMHFSFTRYCTIFRAHFSELHPIYQIMQHHCLGSTPHISLTWHTLMTPKSEADIIFAVGYEGVVKLVQQGHTLYHYGGLAYDELLKKRGLDSYEIKYHPFRDDGKLIWNELQRFASSFVKMYYKDDWDVQHDSELQSFANEVSINGTKAPYGGRGKIRGFPSSFKEKEEVIIFITRFIWHQAIHASVMYPVEPWFTFPPLFPSKLYSDENINKTNNNIGYMFARYETLEVAMDFAKSLGNFRINRIMDHYDKIRDEALSSLVEKHYHRFHQCIQKTLETRNALRKSKQQMGYQYLEPKWLTNSIHM